MDQLRCQWTPSGLPEASHEGLEVSAGHTDDAQLPSLPGLALVGALAALPRSWRVTVESPLVMTVCYHGHRKFVSFPVKK